VNNIKNGIIRVLIVCSVLWMSFSIFIIYRNHQLIVKNTRISSNFYELMTQRDKEIHENMEKMQSEMTAISNIPINYEMPILYQLNSRSAQRDLINEIYSTRLESLRKSNREVMDLWIEATKRAGKFKEYEKYLIYRSIIGLFSFPLIYFIFIFIYRGFRPQ